MAETKVGTGNMEMAIILVGTVIHGVIVGETAMEHLRSDVNYVVDYNDVMN